MDNYSIILLIVILFFLVNAFIRYQEGTWISPVSIFSLSGTLLIALSVILAPEYYFSPAALIYILSILLTCFAGGRMHYYVDSKLGKNFSRKPDMVSIISPDVPAQQQNIGLFSHKRKRFLFSYVVFSILASFSATIVLLLGSGFSIRDLFSLDSYLTIASALSENRYSEIKEPFGTTILLSIGFSGNLAAGLLFVLSESRKHKLVSALSIVPVLFYTIIYTARAPFLFSVTLFISSVLSALVFLKRGFAKILTYKNILKVAILGSFLLALAIGTQIARMNAEVTSYDELIRIFNHLKPSFVGNISPFCIWFDTVSINNPPSWGLYSFAGLYDFLGIAKREIGVFAESVDISNSFNYSNIFTLFRAVIEDYTFTGSYIFFFASGFFASLIFRKASSRKIIFMPLLAAIFAFYSWSFIVSIFAYNTIIFAFLIYVAILTFLSFQNGK